MTGPVNKRDKRAIFKHCAPFTNCICEISNAQITIPKILMLQWQSMTLIENSENHSKTSGSLRQYYRGEPNDKITDSESFKFIAKITVSNTTGGKFKYEIEVPSKYWSSFWRTLEIFLINCEINLILTWSEDCVISAATGATKFAVTNTKLRVSVVTLSTEDNAKLLQQYHL